MGTGETECSRSRRKHKNVDSGMRRLPLALLLPPHYVSRAQHITGLVQLKSRVVHTLIHVTLVFVFPNRSKSSAPDLLILTISLTYFIATTAVSCRRVSMFCLTASTKFLRTSMTGKFDGRIQWVVLSTNSTAMAFPPLSTVCIS